MSDPMVQHNPSRSDSPLRLLWLALLWLLASAVASFLTSLAFGFVIGLHNVLKPHAMPWRLAPVLLFLAAAIPAQLVLLLSARSRAKIVGHGDRVAGLGIMPIHRPRLLAALAVLELPCALGWGALLVVWLGRGPVLRETAVLNSAGADIGWVMAALIVMNVGIAPLCEEFFFRGWLWTGLRRHWGAIPVALATAIPWLLLHMVDGGIRRPLFLIPGAIFFSLARHFCGGVRASLVLHGFNNLAALGLVTLSMLSRQN